MTEKTDHEKAAEKRDADKREADRRGAVSPTPVPATAPVHTDDLMTEQEKDKSSDVPGVGPALPPEVEPEPVETIQEQGIGPRTPYPTGNPPPVHEEVTRSQGINKGRDDRSVPKPDKPIAKEPHR